MRFLDSLLWKRRLPSSKRFVIVHPRLVPLAVPSPCHLRLCNPSVWRDHFLFGIHLRRPKCLAWLCYYWLNDGLLCPAEPDVRALETCDCRPQTWSRRNWRLQRDNGRMYSTVQSTRAKATPCCPDWGVMRLCMRDVLGVNVSLLLSVSLNGNAGLVCCHLTALQANLRLNTRACWCVWRVLYFPRLQNVP